MNELIKYDQLELARLQVCELAILIGIDYKQLAKSLRQRFPNITKHKMHVLWDPYFTNIEKETDHEKILQSLIHPGKENKKSRICLKEMMPPLAIFDDAFHLNGPHKEGGWDVGDPLIKSTTVILETLEWLNDKEQGANTLPPPLP